MSVEDFISKNKLMNKGESYLTALSGGADSVALTLALKRLGYSIHAVHCNFHLRGEESDRDEQFCRSLCEREDIPLHVTHFDTVAFAQLHKISIEMAARKLRYAYFEQLLIDLGAEAICVGHHREDSVETLLINLIRGTGINGLTGISAKNGRVVRPLLNVSRQDIETFLGSEQQNFVTDSTNLVDDVTRNKIRLNLMPLIRGINPSADKDIVATARRLGEAAKVFNDAIGKAAKEVMRKENDRTFVDISRLSATVSPEYTLFTILNNYGFSPAQIEDIHAKIGDMQTGKVFNSVSHRLLVDRDCLVIEPIEDEAIRQKTMRIPEEGVYRLDNERKISIKMACSEGNYQVTKDPNVASLDADDIHFPLTIRTASNGDWLIPYGMKGRKLVSNLLTDKKLSLFDKQRQLIMEDASGNILWVVGVRTDNRYRVKPTSQRILTMVFTTDKYYT